MGWCPECEGEYVEGIIVCVDCGCALVDSREELEALKAVALDSFRAEDALEDEALAFTDASLQSADAEDPEGAAETNAKREEVLAAQQMRSSMGLYRNHDERAEEHRSSAYTLLAVGGLGVVAIFLFFFDVFPIRMAAFNKYMISGVMGVMFILFLVMGVTSMKKSKVLARKAGKENNLTKEIKGWSLGHIHKVELDSLIFTSGEAESFSDEIKYFRRYEKVKEIIESQFMNLEEGYLDRLVDEIYPEIFEGSIDQ